MKVYTCFLLFRIFAYTNSLAWIRQKGDHRGDNLQQKTFQEYSNEEYSGHTNNLENVYNFQIRDTTRNIKLNFRAPRVETLTDFIQEAVHILNTYKETALENFFHILVNEIRKYHYRGCKFSELTQNSDTRSLLVRSLKSIKKKPVSFTKANINQVANMLRNERYDKNVKELLDYINSLYKNTNPNFHSVLNKLKYYRKTKSMKTYNSLVQVIRGGVRLILFDHYTELNPNTRRELKERIVTFWKQFKNNPASSAEINGLPYPNPVIKSVVKSIKLLKIPQTYSKNDPQLKLKNKSGRIVSIEAYKEQFQDDETDMSENSNEFWKPDTDQAIDESSSKQSFDSSSNSIKTLQDRYNTQRYMTLYKEKTTYKAKTAKKTAIIPTSANVMIRRPKVKKRPTTTSTPRERDVSSDRTEKIEKLRANYDTDDTKLDISHSSHDTERGLTLGPKHKPRAKENYDKQRKQGKADKSRFKSKHKNAHIISQYDAVIDVQLANTELLESLRMLEPLGMDSKSFQDKKPVRNRYMRTQAQIKPRKLTAPTEPPSRYMNSYESFYRKQFDQLKRSLAPNESHSFKQYEKDTNQEQKSIVRRSSNDTIGVKDFNKYVIERINTLEKELHELKQMNDFSSKNRKNYNNTDEVEVSNVTDKYEAKDNDESKRKYMKGNVIERLLNDNHDLNNENVNDRLTTKNNTLNTESTVKNTTFSEPNVIRKDAVNETVIDNKKISLVTNNNVNVTNNTKEINKEVITNNTTSTVTSVTNTTKLESIATTPTVVITKRTIAYSEPSYYDYPVPPEGKSKSQLDPFDHNSDGFMFDM